MKRQRGIILISALILVALATIVSATLFFESAISARRAKGNFLLEEAIQITQGSEALAAYALADDKNETDSMADSWTTAYGPVELEEGIVLSAQLTDEQAKFNINTLVKADGTRNEDALKVFKRLLELSEVETRWASLIVDWLDPDSTPQPDGAEDSMYTSQDPPHLAGNVLVTSITELLQIPGFSKEIYKKLAPHITALPPTASQVNVCLADGIVLDSLFAVTDRHPGYVEYSRRNKEEFDKQRSSACYPEKQDLMVLEPKTFRLTTEKTNYFRLETAITIGTAEFTLYSLMYKDGRQKARAVARTFGTD